MSSTLDEQTTAGRMPKTAPAATTAGLQRDSARKVIAASMIGTAIEFFDFYAYGTAAANYFPTVFFPQASATVGVLASLLTFAVAFVARPFGSLLFGHFGDRLGRKTTLVVSLLTMGVATVLIGVLPGFAQAGVWAVVLLCLCRFCQGIGLGGEWSGAALVATENAPSNRRALYGSFPELGAPIGFLLCNGLFLLLETVCSHDQMLAWGWRVPFLLSGVLVVIGLWVRVTMEETPVFKLAAAQNRTVKAPLVTTMHDHWRAVVQGTLVVAVTYTLFYMLTTWSLSYGTKTLGFSNRQYLAMLMISVVVFAGSIVGSCVLADHWGRKKVLTLASAGMVVFSCFFGAMLGHLSVAPVMVFLCVGFLLMGAAFGPLGAFLPELFPAHVRYTGSGIAYNLAAIVGAAFAPSIATALARNGVQNVGLYLGLMAVLSLMALFTCRETKDVDYRR